MILTACLLLAAPVYGAPTWSDVATVELPASGLVVEAATAASCCTGAEPAWKASPVRLYMTVTDGGGGWLLYLGADDSVVLASMSGPDVYDEVVHTQKNGAKRGADAVTLTFPADKLPGGQLRLWTAHTVATKVLGEALPASLADGGIPSIAVVTGRPAEQAEGGPARGGGGAPGKAPGSGEPGMAPPTPGGGGPAGGGGGPAGGGLAGGGDPVPRDGGGGPQSGGPAGGDVGDGAFLGGGALDGTPQDPGSSRRRLLLFGIGAAVLVGGLVLGLLGDDEDEDEDEDDDEVDDEPIDDEAAADSPDDEPQDPDDDRTAG
jgi:hypothetical protein